MTHNQISIKFNDDVFDRLVAAAQRLRVKKHAFVINCVEEMLKMISNRGCEKLPLLVVQARLAEDYQKDTSQFELCTPNTTTPKTSICQEPI